MHYRLWGYSQGSQEHWFVLYFEVTRVITVSLCEEFESCCRYLQPMQPAAYWLQRTRWSPVPTIPAYWNRPTYQSRRESKAHGRVVPESREAAQWFWLPDWGAGGGCQEGGGRTQVQSCQLVLVTARSLDRIISEVYKMWGTVVAQWLRCYATNWKVACLIPAGVIGFFIDIKSFQSQYCPGVNSTSNRNEYQEHFLGGT